MNRGDWVGTWFVIGLAASTGCDGGDDGPGEFPLPPAETQPFSSGVPMSEEEVLAQPTYWEIPNDQESSRVGMWIPPIDEVRGIWVDYYNFDPAFKTARLQMASMYGYAVVLHNGVGFWGEADDTNAEGQSTSERVAEMLFEFVGEVAEHTGREELATAPLIVHGMSRFGSAGAVIANAHGEHAMVAYTNIVAGPGKDSMFTDVVVQTPSLLLPGERDNSEKIMDDFFSVRGAHDPRTAVAMNWREGHNCGNCEQMAFPFFDQAIRARTTDDGGLRDLAMADGWLASPEDWRTIAAYGDYPGDPTRAAWLPNRYAAQVWQAYVTQEPALRFTGPKDVTNERLRSATLSASEALTITLRSEGRFGGEVALQDGDVRIDVAPTWGEDDDGNTTLEFSGVRLLPGLHALIAVQDGAALSRPGLLMLLE